MDYMKDLHESKYHLTVASRMYKSYSDFEEKRFLVGVINELARATSALIRSYLLFEGKGGKSSDKNLKIFMEKIGPKYMDKKTIINIFKTLEIEKAQKTSHIEFIRGNKIILLVEGKYKILTSKRLSEFIDSVKAGINRFPEKSIF
ncbi:MAG: hypothetical protein IH845_03645 [Nanoarchaeota archaeon]|nr:hypothetical protein [Nanoarchaeota archaeon]